MDSKPFDATGAVRFDLQSGAASDSRGTRLVLVPSSALEALGADVLAEVGRHIGQGVGTRVADRLGGGRAVESAPLDVVLTHLAGELAVAGVGAIFLERWGRAMVLVIENASVGQDGFLAAVLSGALSAATGREVSLAPLGREGERARFFVGSAATARRATELAGEGKGHAQVIAALHGGPS